MRPFAPISYWQNRALTDASTADVRRVSLICNALRRYTATCPVSLVPAPDPAALGHGSAAPILFGLARHGGRRRILDLEPVSDAARTVRRAEPL